MIRINLLPHRAEKRKRRQIQFYSLCVVSLILAGVLVAVGYGVISARIFYQDRRNEFLKNEIVKLDKQIEELKRLREQTKALLARKEVVENLQSTRADVVHLMDQMLRILPDGTYLRTLKQTGNKISIVGAAQSNARVSTLMRAIEHSPYLDTPILVEVRAGGTGKERINEFSLNFNLTKQTPAAHAAASAPAATPVPAAASAPVAASAPAAASTPAAAPAAHGGKKE